MIWKYDFTGGIARDKKNCCGCTSVLCLYPAPLDPPGEWGLPDVQELSHVSAIVVAVGGTGKASLVGKRSSCQAHLPVVLGAVIYGKQLPPCCRCDTAFGLEQSTAGSVIEAALG